MAVQEREQEFARCLKAPPVNEKAVGHVTYDSAVGSAKLLALMATAGASQVIAGQEMPWSRLGMNGPDIHFTPPPVTIEDCSGNNGWLGERYYIVPQTDLAQDASSLIDERGFTTIGMNTARYAAPLIEHLPAVKTTIVNVDPVAMYRRARRAAETSRTDALTQVQRRLDSAKNGYTLSPPREVIGYLADDLGVGQLITARAIGVTPTAVRKWRRGETAKPEHRGRLGSFAAMCSLLMEMGLHDPAGWLDIPVSEQSSITPLDLFTRGRPDLAVLLGSRLADPQETLDAFDVEWRRKFPVDADYEVVTLRDGSRSALARQRTSAE